jgi:hypothetical protein
LLAELSGTLEQALDAYLVKKNLAQRLHRHDAAKPASRSLRRRQRSRLLSARPEENDGGVWEALGGRLRQFLFFPTADGYGVLLDRPYHELLVRFEHARGSAATWGELLKMLGPNEAEFVLLFTQCDELLPEASDSIESLLDDVWVLYTEEFPFVQCAEESYSFYGSCFPEVEGARVVWTEYGMQFRLYPESSFLYLKRHLERGGHTLDVADHDEVRLRLSGESADSAPGER